MNKGVLRVLGWVAVLTLVLVIGAVAGGGAVYAMTRFNERGNKSIQVAVPEELDPEPGIVVASVVPGEAADEAGVERGDILLEVDGKSVDSVPDLVALLREYEVGDEVELFVRHGDDERTLTATLGELDGSPYLGLVPCAPMPGVEQHMVVRVRGAEPGAVIVNVEEDSPASAAGLQPGDVILSVDGQELDAENSLAGLIAGYEPGDTVTLTVERPGQDEDEEPQEVDVEVELGEHPEEEGVAYLGVRYRASSRVSHLPGMGGEELPFQRRHLEPFFDGQVPEFPGEGMIQGAVVQSVTEGSPAELAGLTEGDVITAIDGETVKGPGDVVEAIAAHAPGDQVMLTLVSPEDGEERDVEVELAEHPDEEDKAYLGVQIGAFIHVRRFHSENGESLDLQGEEFEYNFDWEMPSDGLHLELPPLDEFDFDHSFPFGADEASCCSGGV